MPITWTFEAEESLADILKYYEEKVSTDFSESIEDQIYTQVDKLEGFEKSIPVSEIFPTARKLVISKLPYVAFIRERSSGLWEVVDIVHTSRKIPTFQESNTLTF
jgi:plasmid stabilization system protein ParE